MFDSVNDIIIYVNINVKRGDYEMKLKL